MSQAWSDYLPGPWRQRVQGSQQLQRILGNMGWLVGDRCLRLGAGLLVGVWVARYLGPEQFGSLSYAAAFVGLFGVLATLGLDAFVVRELVSDPESREEVLGTAILLKLMGGTVGLLAMLAAIQAMRPGDAATLLLVAVLGTGLLFQSLDALDFFFQAHYRAKLTVTARNAAFAAMALTRLGLIAVKAPLWAFAAANLAELALGAVGLAIAYRFSGHRLGTLRFSSRRARELLRDSWPVILSGMAITVYMRIDQLMLGQMLGAKELGLYTAAVRLSEVWYFIPMAIVSSVFPAIVAAKAAEGDGYRRRLEALFQLMAGLGYLVAVPMTFLSGWLVQLLFHDAYAAAGPILAVHIWAGVFVFLGVARGSWAISENMSRFALVATLLGAVCNVLINLLLIPRMGAMGAAIGTVSAQLVASVLANAFMPASAPIFRMQVRALLLSPLWSRAVRAGGRASREGGSL